MIEESESIKNNDTIMHVYVYITEVMRLLLYIFVK